MSEYFTDKQILDLEWDRVIGALKSNILDLQNGALQVENLKDKMARMAGKKSAYVASLRAEIVKLNCDLFDAKERAENLSRSCSGLLNRVRELEGELQSKTLSCIHCSEEYGEISQDENGDVVCENCRDKSEAELDCAGGEA